MTKARDTANLTGSGVGLSLLDIDAGTDIGAALVDADLMIVDDGAGGTNRKATMSRLATYMGTKIGGGMEFISSSGAISNAASVAFTGFDAAKYDHYKFYFQHVIPATDNVFMYGYVSTDGGSNYDTTNGNYHHSNADDIPGLEVAESVGSDSNEYGLCGYFELFAPHNSSSYTMSSSGNITFQTRSDGGIYQLSYTSIHLVAQDVDAIQFAFSSGNIESGEITMFGIVNS